MIRGYPDGPNLSQGYAEWNGVDRMIDSRHLEELPSIPALRRLCQSLAMLDAILSPEWAYRYYSFDSRWSPESMLGSMRNGSGDDFFILFDRASAIIKGYAHETPVAAYYARHGISYPGVVDGVPLEFGHFLAEPAVEPNVATFCLWRKSGEPTWQAGSMALPDGIDPDGSAQLLKILDGNPGTYCAWAQDYFELDLPEGSVLPRQAVAAIYGHAALSQDLITSLNRSANLSDLAADIERISYPALS